MLIDSSLSFSSNLHLVCPLSWNLISPPKMIPTHCVWIGGSDRSSLRGQAPVLIPITNQLFNQLNPTLSIQPRLDGNYNNNGFNSDISMQRNALVCVKFVCTNIFGHVFVSMLDICLCNTFIQTYSGIFHVNIFKNVTLCSWHLFLFQGSPTSRLSPDLGQKTNWDMNWNDIGVSRQNQHNGQWWKAPKCKFHVESLASIDADDDDI